MNELLHSDLRSVKEGVVKEGSLYISAYFTFSLVINDVHTTK